MTARFAGSSEIRPFSSDRSLDAARTPLQRADTRQQLPEVEGLDEVVVRARCRGRECDPPGHPAP